MKYRVTVDHSKDGVQVFLGDILYAAPEHQQHADDEARMNNRLFGLELDLVAVTFEERRGFFTFPRSDLEPLAE